MFTSKKAGFYKKSKLATCVLLALCIVLSAFLSMPFATFANNPDSESLTVKPAIFVAKSTGGSVANTFIPVDIPKAGEIAEDAAEKANLYSGETYFKLTFACKMLSGTKPVVGVMRVINNSESGSDKTFSEPSWCNNAADVTVENGICTAYFKVDFARRINYNDIGFRSFYITIGNAEHSGASVSESDFDASFIMSDPVLVACNSAHKVIDETNRLSDFTEENINFNGTYFVRSDGCDQYDSSYYATPMVWHVDSSPALVKAVSVPLDFNTSSDYDAANFTKHEETTALREYYTNDKYSGLYFEKLANSADNGFAVISNDLNKKFIYIEANHQGEPDNTTVDGYVPSKNKVGNVFLPITLGQYVLSGGATANQKVLLKVTFTATRLEGDGAPVLGRIVGMKSGTLGRGSRAWGLSTINVRGSAYYTNYNRSDNGGGVRPQCTYNPETGEFVGWVGMETGNNDLATVWGIHEVLTIGNAEHVYQAGTFDSTSFNSSFAISNIKVDLYSTTVSGNEISANALMAEDIAPALTADNIDTAGDWFYKHSGNNSNHENDLIRASQNKWHIDGEKSLVSFVDMDDITAYSPRYSVNVKGASGVLGTYFTLEAGKTYRYSFRSKCESAAKPLPFVEFITASGAKKLDTSNYLSDLNGYYNTSVTFKTPADLVSDKNVRFGIDFTSANIEGTFGGFEIYEIDGDGMVSGSNLLKKTYIKGDEVFSDYSADAAQGVWMTDGTLRGAGTTFNAELKEDEFYYLPESPAMLMFRGTNTTAVSEDITSILKLDGSIKQTVTIEAGKKYRFSANIKYAATDKDELMPGFTFDYTKKTGKTDSFTSFTSHTTNADRYLEVFEFTAPSNLSKANNFTVKYSLKGAYNSGYLANLSLVELDESGNVTGDELLLNGNFAGGTYTGWTRGGSFDVFFFSEIPENFFNTNPAHKIHALQYRDAPDYSLVQQMLMVNPSTNYELAYTSLVTGYTYSEPYGVLYQKLFNENFTDSSWTYMRDNSNPATQDYIVDVTKTVINEKALKEVQGVLNYSSSEVKDHSIRVTNVFKTADNIRMNNANNLSVRFYFMTGSSGYLSDFTLYEIVSTGKITIKISEDYLSNMEDGTYSLCLIDKNGARTQGKLTVKGNAASAVTFDFDGLNLAAVELDGETLDRVKYTISDYYTRTGGNIVLDGDFSGGYSYFDSSTPWKYPNEGTVRNVELENGFFENYTTPEKMFRSNGDVANATYGNQIFVDPDSRYYFSGNYVKTNFVGLNPEVFYRSVAADGEYVKIPIDQYFDATRYYFETDGGFTIPDDAVITNGKADIIVRINNLDHGKGYFCNLTLTQDNSGKNLFDDSKATLGKYVLLDYDPEKFMPFEGDEGFEDGDWSGENSYSITTGALVGTVLDDEGYTYPGITMKLMPGGIKSITDDNGTYGFKDLNPGEYSLYLVEDDGTEIFCTAVTVKAGIQTGLPDIYYKPAQDEFDDGEISLDDDGEPKTKKYGALKGYCYDQSGKLLSDIDIYVNSKSHHAKTDSKGMFTFDQVPPGEYKVCTILSDGSVHVFRTVKIEAGKGTVIRVMMPKENSGLPLWLIIVLIAAGALLLGAGAVVAVILIAVSSVKRKKAKAAAAETAKTV